MPGQTDLFAGPRQRGKAPPSPTEFAFHCVVADTIDRWLAPGWFFFHPANGEQRETPAAGRLKRMGVKPGVADLILFGPPHGSLHALELKRRNQHPTVAQAAFLNKVRFAGGYAGWADNYNDAVDILLGWGALVAGFERQPDGTIVIRRRAPRDA